MPLLDVRGLTRTYSGGRRGLFGPQLAIRAVAGVDLTIRRGETLALVGESGCGKSTIGRLLIGLDRPTAGTVRFDGVDLAGTDPGSWRTLRRRMQMIFQDTVGSLNPRLRIGTQLREPLDIHAVGAPVERDRRVVEALEAVALSAEHADRFPHELSGGQQQRAVIARALVTDPDLIVCDEPVSALDLTIQAQVVELLADLQARHRMAFLFISHDLKVVRRLAHTVAVMYLGRIVEHGPAERVLNHPRHPYTRTLLAAVPIADPRRRDRPRLRPLGEPPSPVAPPPGCAYNPRCPRASDLCRTTAPDLAPGDDGRSVACHHPVEGADHG